ncbi:MAG: hypothetical protein ACP5D2_03080 [Candidatus Nanoarchaeia archaeon]
MKYLVLYSGGLDSRLVVSLLNNVEAVTFRLPFSKIVEDDFLKQKGIKHHVIDVSGKLLKSYLSMLKNARHGRGKGYNPCTDCKIWMLKQAKKFGKHLGRYGKDWMLATGDVKGQRPMSQTAERLRLIDKHVGNVYRPLVEMGLEGRNRKEQRALAERHNINYPSPAGGCLLCEPKLAGRFRILIEKNLINDKTLPLVKIGRHFYKQEWFVVGRNEEENKIIEQFRCLLSSKGKPAVYYQHDKEQALEFQDVYSKKGNIQKKKKFEQWKL